MGSIIDHVIVWTFFILIGSIGWDLFTYEQRQTKWEREHPGATYIPGYKRTLRQSERLKRKNGVL